MKDHKTISEIIHKYSLDIESPFIISVEGNVHEFQFLVKGYGADRGMIVDSDWDKIQKAQSTLLGLGYGFSCFDLESCEVIGFGEVLDDWGKASPNQGN